MKCPQILIYTRQIVQFYFKAEHKVIPMDSLHDFFKEMIQPRFVFKAVEALSDSDKVIQIKSFIESVSWLDSNLLRFDPIRVKNRFIGLEE